MQSTRLTRRSWTRRMAFLAPAAPSWTGSPVTSVGVNRCDSVVGMKPFVGRSVRVRFAAAPVSTRNGAVVMTMPQRQPASPRPLQRLLACALYLVPLLDVIVFGKFVFNKIPVLKTMVLVPFAPLLMIYRGIPFVAFGVFLLVYFFIGKNSKFSYFVRYNAHQAILLDMAILIPQLLLMISSNMPVFLEEAISTAVFYTVMSAVGYCFSRIVRGRLPKEIPVVSDAVEHQVGSSFDEDHS